MGMLPPGEKEAFPACVPLDLDMALGNVGMPAWGPFWLISSYRSAIAMFRGIVSSPWNAGGLIAGGIAMLQGNHATRQFGCKSWGYAHEIALGRCSAKPAVKEVKAHSVIFVDGSEFECDMIVTATGFRAWFDYAEEAMPGIPGIDQSAKGSYTCTCPMGVFKFNPRDLYKHMIHPQWREKAVFAGFARPAFGSIPQLSEMQARYYTALLNGSFELPPNDELISGIKEDSEWEIGRHWSAKNVFPLVSFAHYSADLAEKIGSLPRYDELLFTRPRLLLKLLMGQYTVQRFYVSDPDPAVRKMVEDNLPPPPPPLMGLDIHMLFVMVLLYWLGVDSLRPPSFEKATATHRLVAWAGLPLWLLLLTPSFYFLFVTATFRVLHPMNLIRYHKIYVKGIPDGAMDFASSSNMLVSSEFAPVRKAIALWTKAWLISVKPVLFLTVKLTKWAWK